MTRLFYQSERFYIQLFRTDSYSRLLIRISTQNAFFFSLVIGRLIYLNIKLKGYETYHTPVKEYGFWWTLSNGFHWYKRQQS